jgi:two-component system chemotaxis response regulator CheB
MANRDIASRDIASRDIVIIGASSGGLEALTRLIPLLPEDLPAAVFIVMHLPPSPPSILHQILQPRSRWPVLPAVHGASVRHGVITVAVNDHHLLFHGNTLRLARGPRENRARPSVDACLRSAAMEFGSRVIGVVLTGNLDDGTAGLWAVKDRGGVTITQSPDEAAFPSMPRNALTHAPVDHVVTITELPDLLSKLTREQVVPAGLTARGQTLVIENRIAAGENAMVAGVLTLGGPSANTCPHCHGTLMEVNDSGPLRFRCHTGHAFSPESLLLDLDRTIDDALWNVLRAIDERQMLLDQLIQSAKVVGDQATAQEYARQSEDARMRGDEIRGLVMGPQPAAVASAR